MSYRPATQTELFDISLRRAGVSDLGAVASLAALDEARVPSGRVLIAEVAGEPWAAMSLTDGHVVADPFRRSAAAVELLRARAAHVRPARARRPLLRLRTA